MHLCNSLQLYLVVVILRKSRPTDLTNQSDRPVGAELSTGYGQSVENTGISVDKLWISCG